MSHRPVVAVFAGSSTPKDPTIIEAAMLLGRKLAEAGYDLVYGGGDRGVMGAVAKAAHDAGAHVTAIVVEKYAHEWQLPNAEIINVKTESERFERMSRHNDPVAYFALPGGPGALREALQGLERAVYESGPDVILVQTGPYLDGVKQYFDLAVAAGLISESKKSVLKMWSPDSDLAEVMPPRHAEGASASAPGPHK